jgi:Ca2+:H+ antiporter
MNDSKRHATPALLAAVLLAGVSSPAPGISDKDTVLLKLTLVVGVITLGTGRTTVPQGMVHLTILAACLLLSVLP